MSQSIDQEYRSLPWLIRVAVSISLGTLTYSFQMNCMNDALQSMLIIFQVSEEDESWVQGLLTSSVFIGAFIGALCSLLFLKISGRRAIMAIDLILIIGSILLSSHNPYIFMSGRLIGGLGCGAHSVMIPLFIKQIAPKQVFGLMAGIYQITYAVGFLFTEGFGLMLVLPNDPTLKDINYNTMKIYFMVPSIFSLIRIVLFIVYVRFDSPQYYVEQNQNSQAEKLISRIYKQEYVKTNLDNLYSQKDKQVLKVDLFSDTYKLRFYLAISINTLLALCGVGAIQQYTTLIFMDSFGEKIALQLTFLLSIMKLISCVTSTIVSQRVGRRPPFLIGNSVMCISLMGLGSISYAVQHLAINTEIYKILNYLIIVLIFLYMIAIYNSIGFLAGLYLPEIIPGKGVALSYQVYWLLTIMTLFGFPIFKSMFGISVCFFFFGLCTMCGQWVLCKYALETSNKNETEIDYMFDKFRLSSDLKHKSNTIQGPSASTSLLSESEESE